MQIFQLFDGISGYACDIIKIGHHKVKFITGIQTKSVVGRSKKKDQSLDIIYRQLQIKILVLKQTFLIFILSNISLHLQMVLVAQLVKCMKQILLPNVGVSSNHTLNNFIRFFFIIGEKGWAHPKVFRLPHPSMTKCLAFKKLGYRKGLK